MNIMYMIHVLLLFLCPKTEKLIFKRHPLTFRSLVAPSRLCSSPLLRHVREEADAGRAPGAAEPSALQPEEVCATGCRDPDVAGRALVEAPRAYVI